MKTDSGEDTYKLDPAFVTVMDKALIETLTKELASLREQLAKERNKVLDEAINKLRSKYLFWGMMESVFEDLEKLKLKQP